MFPICQHLYTLGVEMDFTRNGDFTWRASDCEELVVLKNNCSTMLHNLKQRLLKQNGEDYPKPSRQN